MKEFPATTPVYDSYWRFATERLAIYYRRMFDPIGPWTQDPILSEYRFTNTFRASDRVSQYLIREIQYRPDRSQAPSEVFFRTMLFKIFNRIDTWEYLEENLGPITWKGASLEDIDSSLHGLLLMGRRIYAAAYIMPSPNFGKSRKHSNHLAMLGKMMDDGLASKLIKLKSLKCVYEQLLSYPGLGPFLAFQYAIDLNYSSLLDFEEADYVVAGPGALDGISKCFVRGRELDPVWIIDAMADRQEAEFSRLGLTFDGLFGRPLQPIDCQNIFCEISKYARVAHPQITGASGRTRIKQRYGDGFSQEVPTPTFPPKWRLIIDAPKVAPIVKSREQFVLF